MIAAVPDIVVAAVFILHIRIIVFHAMAVRGIVLPVVVDVDVGIPVHVDIVPAPIDAAAPVVSP